MVRYKIKMYDRWGGNLRVWKYGDTCNCDTERETDKRTDEIRETRTWAKLFMPHSLIK